VVERLNFYDFYGYLLPGFALVILLWSPFGIAGQSYPTGEFISGIAALAVAYFFGQLLQAIGESAFPARVSDSESRERIPSDILLDSDNDVYTKEIKQQIAARVEKLFRLNVGYGDEWTEELGKARGNAFFLSRSKLMDTKRIVYAEQFQGLYALMLGLTLALGLGVAYLVGWAASFWDVDALVQFSRITCGLSIVTLVITSPLAGNREYHTSVDRITLAVLGIALLTGGYALGVNTGVSWDHALQFMILAALSAFASLRFFNRYRYFAMEFAKAVWNQFAIPEDWTDGAKSNVAARGGAG
jgi:hypothetical protein